jgi:type IV secretory pathway VirB3-like protein
MNAKNKKAVITAAVVFVVSMTAIVATAIITDNSKVFVVLSQLPTLLAFAVLFWRVTRIWKEDDEHRRTRPTAHSEKP